MKNINNIGYAVSDALFRAVNNIISFIPQLIAAVVILLIGMLVASALRGVILRLWETLKVGKWLRKAGISNEETQDMWARIFSQLVFWSIIIVFLVPAVESLGVRQITSVMNSLLLYLPNIFASVIIGFIGMILANFLFEIVQNSASGFGERAAGIMANITRYSIMIFTAFIVLNQLGVAKNLIEILFTGVVATITIAAGLAIGLGGQEGIRKLVDQGMQSKMIQSKLKSGK